VGPTCQSPRAAPTLQLKAAVGTARRASRQHLASPAPRLIAASRCSPPTVASPAPPTSRPPRARRLCPYRSPRSHHRPDRHGPKPPTPSRAARRSPVAVAPRRLPAISRALVPSRRRLAEQHRRRAVCRGQCRRALMPCAMRCAGRPSWAASAAHAAPAEAVGRASTAHAGHAPRGRRPRCALCILAERRFGPVAPG
jgi:hypothetical protein